jgi:hypothetical protein
MLDRRQVWASYIFCEGFRLVQWSEHFRTNKVVAWYSHGADHIENTSCNSTFIVLRRRLTSNDRSRFLFCGRCLGTGPYVTIPFRNELNRMDWIHLAHDRAQFLVLVNIVLELGVPWIPDRVSASPEGLFPLRVRTPHSLDSRARVWVHIVHILKKKIKVNRWVGSVDPQPPYWMIFGIRASCGKADPYIKQENCFCL